MADELASAPPMGRGVLRVQRQRARDWVGETLGPPVNVDVPYVQQNGALLNCTMGNWNGEPTSYGYQWQIDAVQVGSDSADYPVNAADVGHTATCTVTATNALGSTTAPPSNGVVVA